MSQAGIPVPAGFTVTADSCARYYDDNKTINDEIANDIKENISKIEILTGKTFGGASNPLLLSIRSNSRQSVPGLMDTILHLGMNDTTAEALSIRMSNPKTAYEYYLNFITVYSTMIKRFGKKQYAGILEDYKSASGKFRDEDLSLSDLKELILLYKESYKNGLGENFPSDPFVQLISAIGAGFHYWDSPRANYYRMVKEIPYSWGTAVTVQTMVYGNFLGERSGTGVAFTRNPSDGKKERLGEFLLNSRTGDVLSGNRTPDKLDLLSNLMPDVYEEFERDCFLIENKYRDIYEINFTIEDGNFFIIKTRKAKRTALAAFTAACDFADEGMCSEKDAIKVLDPANITALRPTNGYEELFDESDEEGTFESGDLYASDKTAVEYVGAVTETVETPDTSTVENVGGIYNYSLFDYELDDIMTEIYSGFNVYDEDIDDRSLTDELKRIVTERIPTLKLEDVPEEIAETSEETTGEDFGDNLPEIEAEDAAATEYSGYKDPSEMSPVGLFNDAFKSAREMAVAMNFEPDELPMIEQPDEQDDSYYIDEEKTDDFYKTKAFADELNAVEEELAEEDIEKRLDDSVSLSEDDEYDVEALEEIPEELPDDPFMPLPEPPLSGIHADDSPVDTESDEEAQQPSEPAFDAPVEQPTAEEHPKTAEPIGAHKRHILATSPLDRIFSVINSGEYTVPEKPVFHEKEPSAESIQLDDISEKFIVDEKSDADFAQDEDNDISKDIVNDDGSVSEEFSPEALINAPEAEERRSIFAMIPEELDNELFNPEDEINIPDTIPPEEEPEEESEDDGFLFDDDFDFDDDLPPPPSFEDEIEAVAEVAGAADGVDGAADVVDGTAVEVADEVMDVEDVEDEVAEIAEEIEEIADEVTEIADVVEDVAPPAKVPVSTDELFRMINKATAKPHKIKVTPIRRK
jgi:hypothetical protein